MFWQNRYTRREEGGGHRDIWNGWIFYEQSLEFFVSNPHSLNIFGGSACWTPLKMWIAFDGFTAKFEATEPNFLSELCSLNQSWKFSWEFLFLCCFFIIIILDIIYFEMKYISCDIIPKGKWGKAGRHSTILHLAKLIHDPFILTLDLITKRTHPSLPNPTFTKIPYINTEPIKTSWDKFCDIYIFFSFFFFVD